MANAVEVVGDGFDCDDETTFLFTSESVGEGHPGAETKWLLGFLYDCGLFMRSRTAAKKRLLNLTEWQLKEELQFSTIKLRSFKPNHDEIWQAIDTSIIIIIIIKHDYMNVCKVT